MSQKLTPRKVDTMASNMVETISREKLAVTLSAIRRLRARGKFPKENDEYEAFLGKSASTNTRNAAGLLQQKTKPVFVQDVFNNAQRFKKPEVFLFPFGLCRSISLWAILKSPQMIRFCSSA